MDIETAIQNVADKILRLKDTIVTEEATKTAFVMPFIGDVLGFDIFDPTEVVPEYTADYGVKKGEKVDYALVLDGKIQILVECKKIGEPLVLENASQLYRYFSVTDARVSILTNGQIWQFYMDVDKPNVMDDKPFMVLDLLDIDESLFPQLEKISKSAFDINNVASAAESLKYLGALRREIASEFKEPSEDLVRLFGKRVYEGLFTRQVLEKFKPLVVRSLKMFLNDQANDRLKTALNTSNAEHVDDAENVVETDTSVAVQEDSNGVINTTADEIEGYAVVRAIGCALVDAKRITIRDAKSCCAILLDDNNRRAIVRLYFNNLKNKKLGIFTIDGNVEKVPIDDVSDIYQYADSIRSRIESLDK